VSVDKAGQKREKDRRLGREEGMGKRKHEETHLED